MTETQLHSVHPKSLILSQNSTQSYHFSMERGPRYAQYSELRETKLRIKKLKLQLQQQEQEHEHEERRMFECRDELVLIKTPPVSKRQQNSRRMAMAVAQSVPDFSLAKENRKPSNGNVGSRPGDFTPPMKNKAVRFKGTPPSSNKAVRFNVVTPPSSKKGSESANVGEKRGLMARKSCASIEELRGVKGSSRKTSVRFREF